MPDDGFVDVPADGFIDVPARTVGSTLLERLGRQAVAPILRFPTDTLLGISGALGSDWAARNAQMIGNRIDSELGTREVNVFDPNNTAGDYSEFAVRNGISALVGLPVRAATAITGSIKPGMRIVEALTPVTLPLTRGNIVANAVGSNAVTAAVQGLNELDENARGRVVAPSDGFVDVAPEQATTPVPLGDGFVDVPTEQPRSTYGMIRDNIAPVMLGAAALLGGTGAARQVMRNRAANAAMDGSYVGQTQRGNDNYQPGAAETVVQQTLDETASAQAAMTRAAERGLVTPEFARNANEGFSTNISPAPTMERAEEVLNTGRFLDTGITTIAPREYELSIANLGVEDPALYRLFNDASAAGDELNSRTALLNAGQRMPGPLQPGVAPTAARRFLRSEDDATLQQRLDAGYANPRVAQLMAERQQIQAALREFAVHERLYSQQTATKYANAHPEWIHTLDPDNSPFTRRNMTTNRTPEELSDPVISMHEAVRDYVDAALVNRQRRALMEASQAIARTTPDGLQTVGIGKSAPIALANANQSPGTTIIRVKDGDIVMGVEVIPAVARGYQTVPRLVAPFLSSLSRAFSGATVGKVAALVGAVQAFTSAAFAGSAIMASRPRGTSAGILDSALLSATGRNLPIPDPTFILQSLYTGLAGIGAEASRAIASQVLRSIISDGALVRTLGPRTSAFIAKKFGDIYTASSLARARQGGLSTTGINYNPAYEQSIKFANKALTPEYRLLLPKDQAAQGLAAIEEFARFHGRQLTPAFLGRAWQLFGNVLDIIASAPNVAFANQNLGRAGFTDQAVYGMARRLAGDPAARGANPGLQMATSAIPFSNTTMQSIRAHARGFSEHPLRYASTYIMIGGTVPLVTLASALLADEYEGGDKYINYMLNMSARDVLSGAMFFIPGVAPNNGMRIPVDPMFAPGIAAATATVTQFMGIEDYIKSGQLSP